jgi:hypothetical protein
MYPHVIAVIEMQFLAKPSFKDENPLESRPSPVLQRENDTKRYFRKRNDNRVQMVSSKTLELARTRLELANERQSKTYSIIQGLLRHG